MAKAIADALQQLGEVEIDAGVVAKLDVTTRKRCMAALDYVVKKDPGGELAMERKAASTDDQRRAVLAKYMISASQAIKKATNVSSVTFGKKTKKVWSWKHLSTLAGPNYFNDLDMATDAVEGCISQPSSYPKLAAKGILEYWLCEETMADSKNATDTVAVSAEAELDDDSYRLAKESMQQEFDRTPISFGDAQVQDDAADGPSAKKRKGETNLKVIKDVEPVAMIEADKSLSTTAERFGKTKSDLLAAHSRATKEL